MQRSSVSGADETAKDECDEDSEDGPRHEGYDDPRDSHSLALRGWDGA